MRALLRSHSWWVAAGRQGQKDLFAGLIPRGCAVRPGRVRALGRPAAWLVLLQTQVGSLCRTSVLWASQQIEYLWACSAGVL